MLERIGRPGDVVVLERPQHEHDGVDLTDVGEEAVAEALALARPLDQTADVDHLDGGVDDVAARRHRGQAVEALVGHLGDPDVGVLGGEGVRRGEGAAAGEGVVQRALAGVGEPDQSEPFHDRARQANGRPPTPPVGASRDRYGPCWRPSVARTARLRSIGRVTPAEALDRVVHCLDRAHDGGFKAKAFVRAREIVRDLPPEELAERAERGTLTGSTASARRRRG